MAGEQVKCIPVPNSNCACELDNNGGIYDLSVLHKNRLTPLFNIPSKISPAVVEYMYDPCIEFSNGDCQEVAGCKTDRTNSSEPVHRVIAEHEELTYEYDNSAGDQLTLHYTSHHLVPRIETSVVLVCNTQLKEATLEVTVETSTQYNFKLTSSICSPTQPSHSISFGTFLCITVPIVFFTYFTFGFLYLFIVKHETWENAVPHHEFWFSLPGLVGDGVLFTWYFITRRSDSGTRSLGYDQI